jgi:hypothetical protein
MTDVIFHELINRFEEQGRSIEKISSASELLFVINPFTESFLGWDNVTLSHFTLLDCVPLAELSEEEIRSGSQKLRNVINQAIEALKIEETNMKRLKQRALVLATENSQMSWYLPK